MFDTLDRGRRNSYSDEVNQSIVYAIFGGALLLELFVFGFSGYLTSGMQPGWWMLACLIPAFGGIFCTRTDSPGLSLVGGIFCATGLGMFTGPTIASYQIGSIVNVAAYTAGITVCMTVASIIFRSAFVGLGGALFGGLLLLIGADFVTIFLSFMGMNVGPAMSLIDCFAVVLFSIYIGFDMMLLQNARTADNAIDMSVAVFLDIINIFLRLLSLLGSRDD